jgi:hypothetical protein
MATKVNPTEARKFYQQVARWHLNQARTAAGRGDVTAAELHYTAGIKASAEVRSLKAAALATVAA